MKTLLSDINSGGTPKPAAGESRRSGRSAVWSPALLAAFCCIDILAISLIGLIRLHQFVANGFDLGIFQQAIWLIAHGLTPFVTVRGLHILGDHWTPILYPLAWLSRIFTGPQFLIVAQAVVLPLGAIPLYRLALRHTRNDWLALALGASYLLHPSLWGMGVFDFHPSALAVTPLLAAVDALDSERMVWFAGWCALALLCKEDIALAIVMLGLLACYRRRWMVGALTAAVALVWLLFALHEMAKLSHATSSSYWGLYGSTLGTLHNGPVAFVRAVAAKLAARPCYLYVLVLLAPAGFLCLAAPEVLIVAVPSLLSSLLSERFLMQDIGFQYDVVPLAIVYAAAAIGLGRVMRCAIQSGESDRLVRRLSAALLVVSAMVGCGCYDEGVVRRYLYAPTTAVTTRERNELLNLIPSGASVAAPDRVIPHLAARQKVYLFPNPAEQACWGSSQAALNQEMEQDFIPDSPEVFERNLARSGVDYVVLTTSDLATWPLRARQYQNLFASSLACPDYGVVAVGGELVLLHKGAPHIAGLEQLGAPVSDETTPGQVRELVLRKWRSK